MSSSKNKDKEISATFEALIRSFSRDLYGTPHSDHLYFTADRNLGKSLIYREWDKELYG